MNETKPQNDQTRSQESSLGFITDPKSLEGLVIELQHYNSKIEAIIKNKNKVLKSAKKMFCEKYPIVYMVKILYNSEWGRDYRPDPIYYFLDLQGAEEYVVQYQKSSLTFPVRISKVITTPLIAYLFINDGLPTKIRSE